MSEPSLIHRSDFTSTFVFGTIEELEARAAEAGKPLTAEQRAAILAADIDGNGVIGEHNLEREVLFDKLDDLDRDGSRHTVSADKGSAHAALSALSVPSGRNLRTARDTSFREARARWDQCVLLGQGGQHAESAAGFAEVADQFRASRQMIDGPRVRYNTMRAYEEAAKAHAAAGNAAEASRCWTEAQREARGLIDRYSRIPQRDRDRAQAILASPAPAVTV